MRKNKNKLAKGGAILGRIRILWKRKSSSPISSSPISRDGEFITRHPNGKIKYKGTWKDGRIDGEHIYYYESGKIKSKMTYKDGKPHGEFISYFKNGTIEGKGTYKEGKLIK